jgi:transposase
LRFPHVSPAASIGRRRASQFNSPLLIPCERKDRSKFNGLVHLVHKAASKISAFEDRIPSDHLLRRIDRFLGLASARRELRSFYSTIGRPSIDPELMIRMLIMTVIGSTGAT